MLKYYSEVQKNEAGVAITLEQIMKEVPLFVK